MIIDETSAHTFVSGLGDEAGMDRLSRLAQMLTEENDRQNLVAAATIRMVWQRHFADSAQLLGFVSVKPGPWLDLGSGAGFPGLVIACLRPDWPVFLVESRRRRIEWLEHCRAELGLERCTVLGARLERVETFPVGVISARAFAPLPELLSLSARFSTADTLWLLPKGRKAALELAALPKRKAKLFHVEQSLTDPEAGIITGRLAQEPQGA
jgi:16S rRNA (guanine527-N7)-methyltransferase